MVRSDGSPANKTAICGGQLLPFLPGKSSTKIQQSCRQGANPKLVQAGNIKYSSLKTVLIINTRLVYAPLEERTLNNTSVTSLADTSTHKTTTSP